MSLTTVAQDGYLALRDLVAYVPFAVYSCHLNPFHPPAGPPARAAPNLPDLPLSPRTKPLKSPPHRTLRPCPRLRGSRHPHAPPTPSRRYPLSSAARPLASRLLPRSVAHPPERRGVQCTAGRTRGGSRAAW